LFGGSSAALSRPLPTDDGDTIVCSPLVAISLTVLSGLLYGLSFPPFALRPLAWVALIPWLIAIRSGSVWRAVGLGVVWAHVETYVTSDCLPTAIVTYYRQSSTIGWLMLEGATLATMVPYYAMFAVAYWSLSRRFRVSLPFLAAAAWVGCEFGRATVLGGNPWAVLGYSQIGFLPIMQIADLAGVHGISFPLAAANSALADVCMARRSVARFLPAACAASGVIALVAGIVGYGSIRLAMPGVALGTPTRVAIIQGNLDLGAQWRTEMYGLNLDAYLGLTTMAIRETRPKVVFWPENALTFFLADELIYREAIGRVLAPFGAELVTGGPRLERPIKGGEPAYFNTTFLVSSSGDVVAWQDKVKLLPFAEYFPLHSLDLVRREFGRARQFSVGRPRPPLPSAAGLIGPIVCNEAMFPEPASRQVAHGAEVLVNPANDSWFGDLKYSLQAFDIVRLRSVEQRRYLVRTSTAGPSGIVDPWGRIEVATSPFSQEWIGGVVRPSRTTTVYQLVGDLFAIVCAAVAVGAVLAGGR